MKITFLLSVATDAYLRKRVTALENSGIEFNVLAFEADHSSGTLTDGYISLGRLTRGDYHKRAIPILRAIPKAYSAAKDSDVIYAFNLNMLLIGWFASRILDKQVKIVYEVADIRDVLLREGLFPYILRCLERVLLRDVDLLVVTSKAYIDGYYRGIQGLGDLQYQVIENKVAPELLPFVPKPASGSSGETLRIGYFGLIRCNRSWEILREVAERANGRMEVYIRGIPRGQDLQNLERESQSLPNVEYGGPYVSPDDLGAMYGQVDIVWAAYPYQGGRQVGNWRWARTNRFYESCFFKKPMLVQAGTQDCRVVRDSGIGICLDLSDVDQAADRILAIENDDVERWVRNIDKLPSDDYIYADEHDQLLANIR